METASIPTQPNANTPNPTSGQSSKKLYLIVFVGILLIIVAALGYFWLVASKDNGGQKTQSQVATSSAKKSEKEQEELEKVYVTAAEGLNLREEASTSSLITLLLPAGTELKVISSQGDWLFVEATTKGFVHKEFVSSTKPESTVLLTFSNADSPFKFLYPDVYKVSLTKENNTLTYSFRSSDSFGGFRLETVENMATLGNYALQNYPAAQKGSCEPVRLGTQAKECEKVTDTSGTTYLLLVNTTLYKITYLKTEGGLLTDLNNLVFYSLYFD